MSGEKGLESLKVWQRAMDLAVTICKELLPSLPTEERYALSSQLRRSVQSIPANIAEGYGRYYYQESVRFCYIARGSLNETLNHLYLAQRMGYIPEQILRQHTQTIDEIDRMLSGYIAFLKKSKRGATEPDHSLHEAFAGFDFDNSELHGEDLS